MSARTTRERDIAEADKRSRGYWPVADAFADGCAHRDAQTIAFLRELARRFPEDAELMDIVAARIERGEHVK